MRTQGYYRGTIEELFENYVGTKSISKVSTHITCSMRTNLTKTDQKEIKT